MKTDRTAIGAMAFSGATVLSGLLQNIQGVFCPGETMRLIDRRRNECAECKGRCPVFSRITHRIQQDPAYNPKRLLSDLLDVSRKDHVISGDKSPDDISVLFQLPPYGELNLIVLFSDPRDLADSWNERRNKGYKLSELPAVYDYRYRKLDRMACGGKKLFLFRDDMIDHPLWAVRTIASELGLTPPDEAKFPPAGWHYLGEKSDGGLTLIHEWRRLPEEVIRHASQAEMFATLMEKRLLPPTE